MPITTQLAGKLKAAAKGRADHAPLLLQSDGSPWGDNPGASYHREVKKVVAAIGADPDATMYAYDTAASSGCCYRTCRSGWWRRCTTPSIKMIEKHYSKYITEHSDDISRHALLHHEPPAADNVVALAR